MYFWAEAMNTACYVHNRVTLRKGTSSTLYELWRGKKPSVKYFHVFGSKYYILTDRDQRTKREDSTFMSQRKYAKNIVKKFGMDSASHKRTPAQTHQKLHKDEWGISVDQSLYRSMIGSLLYLTTSTPDIAFAVGVCARYQAEPKASHLNQVKRILKYVNGTSNYGLLYTNGSDPVLTGYCDVDWVGSADDRKSTSGGCFFLGNNLISWFSKKQNCVSLSTAEVE
ncbi:secreted RxLR effector protein 161-like [Vicia villosa]|uniref:secreted RxLR effector protein 161-like n=1 Tax=Vicia villosa TaxID=3911 RepID=UPI00273B839A|nr:secreted RxLR effector protein 161-like [Vicia villosa]